MFGNYSKLVGSIVGSLFGLAVNAGLPTDFATPEIQSAITVLIGAAIGTFAFPANRKS